MSIDELPQDHREEALKTRERVMAYIERRVMQKCVYIPNEPIEEGQEGTEKKN